MFTYFAAWGVHRTVYSLEIRVTLMFFIFSIPLVVTIDCMVSWICSIASLRSQRLQLRDRKKLKITCIHQLETVPWTPYVKSVNIFISGDIKIVLNIANYLSIVDLITQKQQQYNVLVNLANYLCISTYIGFQVDLTTTVQYIVIVYYLSISTYIESQLNSDPGPVLLGAAEHWHRTLNTFTLRVGYQQSI